jgi:hypothetical protein
MRATIAICTAVACLCGTGDAYAQRSKSKKGTKQGTPQVSAEMKDFMSYFNGDGKKTDEALDKYRAKDADVLDMTGSLSIVDAKVLKAEKKDGEERYTMYAKTGIAMRTFLIVWKDKKIQRIKQLSLEIP